MVDAALDDLYDLGEPGVVEAEPVGTGLPRFHLSLLALVAPVSPFIHSIQDLDKSR